MIVIFTDSYPYDSGGEQTFLAIEIQHLQKCFDRIVLVPKKCQGSLLPLPDSIEVEESYAAYIKENSNLLNLVCKALSLPSFLREIRSRPTLFLQPAKFLRLFLFLGRAGLTRDWILQWNSDLGQCFFYSYWFDHVVMGLRLIKECFPQVKIVSRAHGYDTYEEKYFPYYWPLRREVLASLNKLFAASNDGRNYFRRRYPDFHDLFETSHLGVRDPGFRTRASMDGVLRIVSCSNIIPLKRVELLLRGIALAARMRPKQRFEWRHFGEGKGRKALQEATGKVFPSNATGVLPGHMPNKNVMEHYRYQPVDVFVNLSTTEGGAPVSIQEAISCGIPVIATNVGGNPEIVSERNGILLSPNPSPEDVAQALLQFCDNPVMARKMREESRKIWQESYNADVNFRAFAERLKAISES